MKRLLTFIGYKDSVKGTTDNGFVKYTWFMGLNELKIQALENYSYFFACMLIKYYTVHELLITD